MKRILTSEYVGFGHPDKLADLISDRILDAYLQIDNKSKVAVETMIKDNIVVVGGEVTSKAIIDIDYVIRGIFDDVKYPSSHKLTPKDIKIINLIGTQSPEINSAVFDDDVINAGDQGLMFGFASKDSINRLPLGVYLSKTIANYLNKQQKYGPDLKTQVVVEDDYSVKTIKNILVSTQFDNPYEIWDVRNDIEYIIRNNVDNFIEKDVFNLINVKTDIIINPSGTWRIGGSISDCGITGRKIVVDQYGSYCPVGGGAFSGKDSSKVDRSGAYLARYIAKNIVECDVKIHSCQVQIGYMIGKSEPCSFSVIPYDKFNYVVGNDEYLENLTNFCLKMFPTKPHEIIKEFGLDKPIFYTTTFNGHFGNDENQWEKINPSIIEEYKEIFK